MPKASFIKHYEVDPLVRNYDYSKFKVSSKDGHRFFGFIYKHNKTYYVESVNTPFETIDDALKTFERKRR